MPYVGAGVLASAVGMDKAAMKLVFAAKGLPICDYEVVFKRDWRRDERAIMQTIAPPRIAVWISSPVRSRNPVLMNTIRSRTA